MNITAAMTTFVRVVELGGFRRAAAKLSISTSVVSSHIQALENHFRARLFLRSTRQISLTHEGKRLYILAQEFLSNLRDLELSFSHEGKIEGSVRVEASSWILRLLLFPHLPKFHELFPSIDLTLASSRRVFGGKEEDADIILRFGPFGNSYLVGIQLGYVKSVCVASPGYLEAHGTPRSPRELGAHSCLGYIEQGAAAIRKWQFMYRDVKHSSTPLRYALTFNDAELILGAAISGLGIAQLSDVQVSSSIASGELVPILEKYSIGIAPPLCLLYRKNPAPSLAVKAVRDFITSLYPKNSNLLQEVSRVSVR